MVVIRNIISVLQNFVDLAGSEKAGENTGDRFREGCSINKSLFTLARIIAKLSEGVRYSIVSRVLSLIMRLDLLSVHVLAKLNKEH